MKKVKMIKDDKYAKQGIFIIKCLKGSVCEVPDDIADAFIRRNSANLHNEIETPKQEKLETQANQEVLEVKKETKGRGRPAKKQKQEVKND